MPTLEWIGKDKVVNHHQEVPFRILDKKYTFNAENSENMIIHGDNLLALKSLLPQYEGRVDCIYIDPPYNTGNEKWVYNDNINDPYIKKWLGEVVGQEGEDLSRHDKWLCMMYPRLKLLHKLLSDRGAIFISIDDNEQANLKLICDEIFGKSNFVTQIIWEKVHTRKNSAINFSSSHEYILVYAKIKRTNANDTIGFKRNLGFVFQFYNLIPTLTVHENVTLVKEIVKNPLSATKMLEEVGLADHAKNFPSELSGGEQQRVSIARALAKNPKILLCDEPTGALDSATGVLVLKLLLKMAREYGKTIVIVTHNQNIAKMADTVIHVKNGKMVSSENQENPVSADEIDW